MSSKVKIFIAAAVLIAAAVWQYLPSANPSALKGEVQGDYLSTTSSEVRLVFFDVGQGDASLIRTKNGEDILIDGGPDKKVVQKLGEYLPPTDKKIEYVILTHPHADHVAGLVEVLKRYEVGEVVMTGAAHTAPDYLEFLRLIKEKNIPTKLIENPQEEIIDGLTLDYLAPEKSYLGVRPSNMNDSSIVIKIIYGSTSAMFTGDFEQEENLLLQSCVQLSSDLLKVGHHGSTNANDQGFLRAVAPFYAVISVGADNTYGHPHYRTIYYLEQLNAKIFRTDQDGDIKFSTDGVKLQPAVN